MTGLFPESNLMEARTSTEGVRLRCADGSVLPLPVERWLDEPGPEEVSALARADSPVLDVGCGPGRLVLALGRRGIPALGLETAPSAVRLGRRRGAAILERSVFGAVPCPGRWGTALLFDGTLGIGGAPPLLLRRLAALLRRGGSVLAELDPAVRGIRTLLARIERGAAASAWFPWSRVGPDAIEPVARQAGLRIQDRWEEAGRWFATAVKP